MARYTFLNEDVLKPLRDNMQGGIGFGFDPSVNTTSSIAAIAPSREGAVSPSLPLRNLPESGTAASSVSSLSPDNAVTRLRKSFSRFANPENPLEGGMANRSLWDRLTGRGAGMPLDPMARMAARQEQNDKVYSLAGLLGSMAAGIAPNSWSGRMGENIVNFAQNQQQSDLLRRKFGLEETRAGQMGRLHEAQIGHYEGLTKKLQAEEEAVQRRRAAFSKLTSNPDVIKTISQNLGVPDQFIGTLLEGYQDKPVTELLKLMGKEGAKTPVPKGLFQKLGYPEFEDQNLTIEDTAKLAPFLKAQTKEFNIPADLDTFLAGQAGMQGWNYMTPEGRQAAMQWYGTPQGQQAYNAWWERRKTTAPPIYNFLQTSEGYAPGNVRAGTVGAPTGKAKPLTGEMITAEQQISTLKDTLDQAKKLYKPDWVGPVVGRTAGVLEQTVGIDPKRSAFNAQVAQMKNTLVYLMSGKQINEQEYERLRAQLPDINLPPKNFQARMGEFERTLNSIIMNRRKNMGGYGISSGANTGARPPLSAFEGR
jgi:hypothetical protein